jgi:Alpha/beta hydrolase family
LSEGRSSIVIKPEAVPKEIRVLSFISGRFLKISVPLPVSQRLWILSCSTIAYLIAGYLTTSLLESAFTSAPIVSFVILLAALAVCIAVNLRGAVLTIWFDPAKYRLATSCSISVVQGLPKVEVNTRGKDSAWESVLSIAGYPVARRISATKAEDAERDFQAFASAFPIELAASGPVTPASPVVVAEPLQLSATKSEAPLIFLVHGTFARKSPWAIPEQSQLATKIRDGVESPVAFDRLEWTGFNRVSDRLDAAARLGKRIKEELAQLDRPIFILAHSHGGNVAIRALDGLPDGLQRRVRLVLMATPFLNNLQRFDVRDVFKLLPAFVQRFFKPICAFSTWLGLVISIELLQRHFVPPDYRVPMFGGSLSLWAVPVFIFLFFAPFVVVFYWVWQPVKRHFERLPAETLGSQGSRDANDAGRLVIAFSQDEAFQALSIVVNLLSLVHQAFFLCVLGVAWLSSRTKLIDWLAAAFWFVFVSLVTITWLGIAGGILLASVSKVWPALGTMPLEALGNKVGQDYLLPAVNFSIGSLVTLSLVIGTIIVAVALSFTVVGTLRIGIFLGIGVLDQIRSQRDFLKAVFGSVSISMMPKGVARTLMLDGRALFNHVKIYDDAEAVTEIIRFIKGEIPAILKWRSS